MFSKDLINKKVFSVATEKTKPHQSNLIICVHMGKVVTPAPFIFL